MNRRPQPQMRAITAIPIFPPLGCILDTTRSGESSLRRRVSEPIRQLRTTRSRRTRGTRPSFQPSLFFLSAPPFFRVRRLALRRLSHGVKRVPTASASLCVVPKIHAQVVSAALWTTLMLKHAHAVSFPIIQTMISIAFQSPRGRNVMPSQNPRVIGRRSITPPPGARTFRAMSATLSSPRPCLGTGQKVHPRVGLRPSQKPNGKPLLVSLR